MKSVTIGTDTAHPVTLGDRARLVLTAGPCVIESRQLCFEVAGALRELTGRLGIGLVFKASFDKANRTGLDSFRGPGLDEGLAILAAVRQRFGVPLVSDIHLPDQAAPAGRVLDMLQIPAFLARQTDLLVAAAKTGRPVQVKKAQFMAPGDMRHVIAKITAQGNDQIVLVERGTCFGYHQLICDMTSIAQMRQLGYPVVMDATHATQQPGGLGGASGGSPQYAGLLARAAVAAGADGLFLETHPDPAKGLSDAASMLPLAELEELLTTCRDIYRAVR
ncbi:MAG: 3-deoxy-8-phosphooctulonate synthase [Sedimentisphaerales bacterium]|nr:3-deoxy-8-phosphooctulonate synthase [Sedimentisphaerales bacterium]